ncbi:magnesium/cobalt transporter CorA [Synechococcus elongatus]|uniref:magnesium/cobalt transporter CorA n=1 Tax=Synechococcus elongatus TaxID=32046 RepID=UPI0012DD942D|nr:magnesium/cobalt transporter CorA [Synechococcus elongatus]MBD2587808.1 magnesium/cobalt transporter CorA [Synechococcus elongatus FACHB-242]MBD2707484.1 magnesium/cobalt transporter CorA [Synechococcus elongatus PCC 7942 = FACHB-805]
MSVFLSWGKRHALNGSAIAPAAVPALHLVKNWQPRDRHRQNRSASRLTVMGSRRNNHRHPRKTKRQNFRHRLTSTVYQAPGTLRQPLEASPTQLRQIEYSANQIVSRPISDPLDLVSARMGETGTTWLQMQGFSDLEQLRSLGEVLELNPLTLEDLIGHPQRPKQERYPHYLEVIFYRPDLQPGDRLRLEQVGLVLGDRWLLTVEADEIGPNFSGLEQRLANRTAYPRLEADTLAYLAIDWIIDTYFPVLEVLGEELEQLEDAVVAQPTQALLSDIYELRRELMVLRRVVWPLRDVINALIRDRTPLIREEVRMDLRDCADHAYFLLDTLETYRDLANNLMEVYLSSISNRLNQVMKLLAILSTVFMPLTLIAGIYGMNFNPEASRWNMPELNWPYGYPAVLLAMVAIAIVLLWLFWQRGWFEDWSRPSFRSRQDT